MDRLVHNRYSFYTDNNNNVSKLVIKIDIGVQTMSKLKHPRCDYCGVKLFPNYRPFIRSIWLFGDIPSHCPDCGKEISIEKKKQFDNFRSLLYLIYCISVIVIISIVIIMF